MTQAHGTANKFSFYGIMRDAGRMGEHWGTWFHDHALLWEKDGQLYRFYKDDAGSASEPNRTGLLTANSVTTTVEVSLFLNLHLEWARDTTIVPLPLGEQDEERTRELLLGWDVATRQRRQETLLDLDLSAIRLRGHKDMVLLADPDSINPEKNEYWGAWGMPNGQMAVGPWSRIMRELDALRRSNWHNLDHYARSNLIVQLADNNSDLPRELRVAGLQSFYRDWNSWDVNNQRSNTASWAEMYFKLVDDPMALPWV